MGSARLESLLAKDKARDAAKKKEKKKRLRKKKRRTEESEAHALIFAETALFRTEVHASPPQRTRGQASFFEPDLPPRTYTKSSEVSCFPRRSAHAEHASSGGGRTCAASRGRTGL